MHLSWWRLDGQNTLHFSPAAALFFEEEIAPRYLDSWLRSYADEDAQRLRQALARLREKGQRFDLVVQRRSAREPVYHQITGLLYEDGEPCLFGLMEDQTSARQIDRRLGETLQAQRDFASRIDAVLFRVGHDRQGKPVTYFLSDQAENLFGLPLADLIGNWHCVHDRIHPEDAVALRATIKQGGLQEGSHGFDARVRAKEGWRHLFVEFRHWIDELGCSRWDGVASRKSSEFDILSPGDEKAKLWERLEKAMSLVLFVHERQGGRRLLRIGEAVESMLGYSASEMMAAENATFQAMCHPDDTECLRAHWEKLDQSTNSASSQVEFRVRHRNGQWVWLRASEAPSQRDDQGRVTQSLGMARDITEIKRSQQWRERRTALDIVGKVAGGVAHDFNNLLTVITANLSLVQEGKLDSDETQQCLNQIFSASDTAGQLTRQLLAFAHTGKPTHRQLAPSELFQEAAQLTVRGTNVQCRWHIDPEVFDLNGDDSLLRQMVHHLVLNAVQAMAERGEIVLRLYNYPNEQVPLDLLPPGDYLAFEVEDNGPGVEEGAVPYLFDPFFSTHSDRSGLGLALANHVAHSSGGAIIHHPLRRRGALFRVLLPGVAPAPREKKKRVSPIASLKDWIGPPPRILMLDDDPNVMEPYAKMLELQGFEVVATIQEQQCLEAFLQARRSQKPFDVVVLDLTMPGSAGGVAVLGKLKEIDPDILAIAHSGYSEDNALQHPKEYGFRAGLAKPAPIGTLISMLEELAQEARGRQG